MKHRNLIIGMLITAVFLVVVSCSKTETDPKDSIDGTYYGTFTRTSSLKSVRTDISGEDHATDQAEYPH